MGSVTTNVLPLPSDRVQTRAAKLLGITQPYMARLMKNLNVSKNDV